jgi:hypothetical protein
MSVEIDTGNAAADLARVTEVGEAVIDAIFDAGCRVEQEYGPVPFDLFLVCVRAVVAVTILRVAGDDRQRALDGAGKFGRELRRKIGGMACNS